MLGDYTFTRNSESKKIKGDSDFQATILRVVFYIMRVFFFFSSHALHRNSDLRGEMTGVAEMCASYLSFLISVFWRGFHVSLVGWLPDPTPTS